MRGHIRHRSMLRAALARVGTRPGPLTRRAVLTTPAIGAIPPAAVAPPSPGAGHHIVVLMLGPFRLHQDGLPVNDWYGTRGQRILKYLIAHRRHPVPKERLIEMIWPEVDPEVGRRNLHQAVYSLRRTLRARQPGMSHVLLAGDCYRLNQELDVWCDAEEFERRLDEGRRLSGEGRRAEAIACYRDADALYQGEYLEDTPYEEWTLAERDRLRACHAEAVHGMTALNLDLGRTGEAVACARHLLKTQPADELAHSQIIRTHLSEGRRGEALSQYRCCAEALDREYGLAPPREITVLCEQLLTGTAD